MTSGREIRYLTLDEVIVMHERLIKRFGGTAGLPDLGLLESALYRPRSGYCRDLTEMATAQFESLINHRQFVDGNKRVAFFASDVFLRINGWRFAVNGPPA